MRYQSSTNLTAMPVHATTRAVLKCIHFVINIHFFPTRAPSYTVNKN